MDKKTFINAFDAIQSDVHNIAQEKGWWEDRDNLEKAANAVSAKLGRYARITNNAAMIALMHSELSEGLEGERKDLESDHIPGFSMLEEELADVVIRAMDMAQGRNLDLAAAIIAKAEFNSGREHKHGGKVI